MAPEIKPTVVNNAVTNPEELKFTLDFEVRGCVSKSGHPVSASKSAHSHAIQWLIDWLSTRICLKVCAPRFCFQVCALPCYSMIDWLIEYEDMSQSLRTPMLFDDWLIDWVRGYVSKSAHFKNRYFPEKNRPNSANPSLPMGIVMILHIKTKMKTRIYNGFPKKGKRVYARFSQSINQSSNSMGVRRLWDIPSYWVCTLHLV